MSSLLGISEFNWLNHPGLKLLGTLAGEMVRTPNALMNNIEKARDALDIDCEKYDPILAICHAATGRMRLDIQPSESKTTVSKKTTSSQADAFFNKSTAPWKLVLPW